MDSNNFMDSNNLETVAARAQRVQMLYSDVERGEYHRAGDAIAAKMLRSRPTSPAHRPLPTLDDDAPAQDKALYAEFWTGVNRESRKNALRLQEWNTRMDALNAAVQNAPVEGSFERTLRSEIVSAVKSAAIVCAIVVFVLAIGWAEGWWLR